MMPLKVLSYNIHKGFNALNLDMILQQLKSSVEAVHADFIFLQEVVAHSDDWRTITASNPKILKFETLTHQNWPHFTYGKNAVYAEGHHGYAILSKHPLLFSENIDVSTNPLENRTLLHAAAELEPGNEPCHLICLHLGLFENAREIQLKKLVEHIERTVPPDAPLIVAGDFNDWRENASALLCGNLGLNEAFLTATGYHAKTFPCWEPTLGLDRLYYRRLALITAETFSNGVWSEFSDHAAVFAEFKI